MAAAAAPVPGAGSMAVAMDPAVGAVLDLAVRAEVGARDQVPEGQGRVVREKDQDSWAARAVVAAVAGLAVRAEVGARDRFRERRVRAVPEKDRESAARDRERKVAVVSADITAHQPVRLK